MTLRAARRSGAAGLAAAALLLSITPAEGGWRTFGVASGLAGHSVSAIAEGRSGELWFAVDQSLSRYDGAVWDTLLVPFQPLALLVDHVGNLWVGTRGGGVSRYNPDSLPAWHSYHAAETGLGSDVVNALHEDSRGAIWLATNAGVGRLDGSSWQSIQSVEGAPLRRVLSIGEDRSGVVWFGTDGDGVCRFAPGDPRPWSYLSGTRGAHVTAIHADHANHLWLGTDSGVIRYDGTALTFVPYAGRSTFGFYDVSAIEEDGLGNLWFGSGLGVSRFDGSSWRNFTTADGLVSSTVRTLRFDHSGNLWVGTTGGASLYDQTSWKTLTGAGLGNTETHAVFQDSTGVVWMATNAGVVRSSNDSLSVYGMAALPSNHASAIACDSLGQVWFGTDNGAVRFDGSAWTRYDSSSGLVDNRVQTLLQDRAHRLWFGTAAGLSVLDHGRWRTFTRTDSLVNDDVRCLFEDRAGNLWVGTAGGVSRYDGVRWTSFTTATSGLQHDQVLAVYEDSSGRMWFGTRRGVCSQDAGGWHSYVLRGGGAGTGITEDARANLWVTIDAGGVSRFDGIRWVNYVTDALPSGRVFCVLRERSGDLWFGTDRGVVRHEPDLVPPFTVVYPRPPALSADRLQTLRFAAAFGETDGIEFSHSLDGEPWTPWSSQTFWVARELTDGLHEFRVKARDGVFLEDAGGAVVPFRVDATAPLPIVSYPAFGQAVRDSIVIRGTADDLRFRCYSVSARAAGAASWDTVDAFGATNRFTPVHDGPLAGWNTRSLQDGIYELRLAVTDTLGLVGSAIVSIQVDNQPPWADQTSPVRISADSGGDVYTIHDELHLYFPPHAFAHDAVVSVVPPSVAQPAAVLPNGARLASPADSVTWSEPALLKAATIDWSLAGLAATNGTLALYHSADGLRWERRGGTVDPAASRISMALTEPGSYALYTDAGAPAVGGTLSALSLSPRVFSPAGAFARRDVAIGFTLARPGEVTVNVFNRAGRVVKAIASHVHMSAGSNLVRWDGRDRDGAPVDDGLYVVTVEALGERRSHTVAVVR